MKRCIPVAALSLALAVGACKRSEKAKPEADAPAPARVEEPTRPAPDPAEAARAREALAAAEEADRAERARWGDELKEKAAALRDREFASAKEALEAIVESPHRMPANRERDVHRHPVDTLLFFGVEPTSNVVEIGAGAGWYTEILAPLLTRRGKLTVASLDPEGPSGVMSTVYGKRLAMFLARSPELYGAVEVAIVSPPDKIELGPPGSADVALAIREMHNWQRRGTMDAYLAAVHRVLKDGGTFGVVQHRAPPDAVAEESAEKGYLPEKWLIQRVEAAGFKLDGSSDVNANPKDSKDHPQGVWTLPPNLREGDADREKYLAIGESDRMTLRFKKVARSSP